MTAASGRVPQIATTLTLADRVGAWKARWGIGRMSYLIPPGLYAVGLPTSNDPVLVTANYKMSYDIVRSVLGGRSAWLLVLETFGINVWCAAGKGTFGTDELVRRIELTGLSNIVSHRRLILPILGAPGIAAHEVAGRTGFSARYATIRAGDLPEYLDNGMVTTPPMQELTFTFMERLVLIPVELVGTVKSAAIITAVLCAGLTPLEGGAAAFMAIWAYLGALIAGVVIAPLFIPWLPGRSFAFKGALIGFAWSCAWYLFFDGRHMSLPVSTAVFLALPAVSAFYTLNFTGCTTFTSRSGVKKEMRIALPAMGCAIFLSLLVLLAGRFL